ncbi:hypothetical protein GCM10023082_42770 [Streptomyces tremellae]|uniref:Uncharacterized protein n=1 Tax=Streptomyces tremellae TaxID=1124239 RepID=A0ABP7FQA0_9ACTN
MGGVKAESSVEPGGGIVSDGGTDGACASSCTVGFPRLFGPAGGPDGVWYRGFVPEAPSLRPSRSGQTEGPRNPGWGSAALKAPA